MTKLTPLLERNRRFAATDTREGLAMAPRLQVIVLTCLDPRVDPAAVLGLELGDAAVLRNAGGRVTAGVIEDLAFIGFMAGKALPKGPLFEVAIVHHTQCGTTLLADPGFRGEFAERSGYSDDALAAEAVTDPHATVALDVDRLLSAPQTSARISVSGHVYSVETGLVETVVEPRSKA
ncbi:MAG TPA: carbonic anhydrase [Solirubrobacterales bacterium]|nr:carbonic anhydrase [Solirubrobacterales bacterium]